jgi:hypothetical protein
VLKVSRMPPCSESTDLEMIKKIFIRHITPQEKSGISQRLDRHDHFGRLETLQEKVGSAKYCIGMTTLVDSTLSKRRVGSVEDCIGVTTFCRA